MANRQTWFLDRIPVSCRSCKRGFPKKSNPCDDSETPSNHVGIESGDRVKWRLPLRRALKLERGRPHYTGTVLHVSFPAPFTQSSSQYMRH